MAYDWTAAVTTGAPGDDRLEYFAEEATSGLSNKKAKAKNKEASKESNNADEQQQQQLDVQHTLQLMREVLCSAIDSMTEVSQWSDGLQASATAGMDLLSRSMQCPNMRHILEQVDDCGHIIR
jgi:hypothetical protein